MGGDLGAGDRPASDGRRARSDHLTPSVWRIDDLNLAANNLMFGPGARPGRLQLSFKLNDAPITVTSDSLVLSPLAAKARATVEGFDVAPVQAYLPPSVPAAPRTGKVSLAMAAAIELSPAGLKSGRVQGKVTTAGLEVFQTGKTEPFLKIPRLDLEIKDADLVARAVTIGSLGVEGLAPGGPRRSGAHRSPGARRPIGFGEQRRAGRRPVRSIGRGRTHPTGGGRLRPARGGRAGPFRLQGESRADRAAESRARLQGRGRQAPHDAHDHRPVGGS